MTSLTPTFTLLDYGVFGVYLLLTAAIGLWFVKGQRDLDEWHAVIAKIQVIADQQRWRAKPASRNEAASVATTVAPNRRFNRDVARAWELMRETWRRAVDGATPRRAGGGQWGSRRSR